MPQPFPSPSPSDDQLQADIQQTLQQVADLAPRAEHYRLALDASGLCEVLAQQLDLAERAAGLIAVLSARWEPEAEPPVAPPVEPQHDDPTLALLADVLRRAIGSRRDALVGRQQAGHDEQRQRQIDLLGREYRQAYATALRHGLDHLDPSDLDRAAELLVKGLAEREGRSDD